MDIKHRNTTKQLARRGLRLAPLALAAALCIPLSARADTIVLNNGKTIKGKIISEQYDHYMFKAEVSPNVFIDQKILKKDVLSIDKDHKSLEDYKKLKKLFPLSDSTSEAKYQRLLKDYLNPFLDKFPRSPYRDQVKKWKKLAEKNLSILQQGGAIINGKLLSPEEVKSNQYDISAILIYRELKSFAQKKKYLAAMRKFEILEKEFPHTTSYREACKIASSLLPRYKKRLLFLEKKVDDNIKKRARLLELSTDNERTRIKSLIQVEEAAYAKSLDLARNTLKSKWLPISGFHKKPITELLRVIEREIPRIKLEKDKPSADAGKIYREAYQFIDNGDFKSAMVKIHMLESLQLSEKSLLPLKNFLLEATEAKKKAELIKKQQAEAKAKKDKQDAAKKDKDKKPQTPTPAPQHP